MPLERRMAAFRLETTQYSVRLIEGEIPAFEISREGQPFFRLPVAGGLERPGEEERLAHIHLHPADTALSGRVEVIVHAQSSLWLERSFTWVFYEDHIEMRQSAEAGGEPGAPVPLGRCLFGADNTPYPWMHPADTGPAHHAQVFAGRVFSPKANLGNRHHYSSQTAQSLGIIDETVAGLPPTLPKLAWDQEKNGMLFCPPPLALCFGHDAPVWACVGVGSRPGAYFYHGFNYSGTQQAGAAFFVDFAGAPLPLADLPVFAVHFGFSEWEALRAHINWLDASGFSTRLKTETPDWHRAPIFCGWAEQTYLAHQSMATTSPLRAADLATQANYERWIAALEERGIPFGTVVIDDKWQACYGTFDVDEAKWPDLGGFIERQHSQGRRVLLWVPGHHVEGLPEAWVLNKIEGDAAQAVCADVTHPEYEAFLRGQIKHLVADLGADGFKEDWIGGRAFTPDLGMNRPVYGMEFLRRFQFILHDETHRHKPDALVETQTPHPLFRESSDVLRLNDLFFGTRDVVRAMRDRARIAHIAGWELVDCDNASSTCVEQWWDYMQAQPGIGIPALYTLTGMESTLEPIPARMWAYLGDLWREYRARAGV